jgi:ABC-type Fe3+-citrate transport system substrate-binding protein
VCDIVLDHSVTPSIGIVVVSKCHLQSEVDEKDVTNIFITGCLNSEQDREEKSAAHATQVELEEATMQVVKDHQRVVKLEKILVFSMVILCVLS